MECGRFYRDAIYKAPGFSRQKSGHPPPRRAKEMPQPPFSERHCIPRCRDFAIQPDARLRAQHRKAGGCGKIPNSASLRTYFNPRNDSVRRPSGLSFPPVWRQHPRSTKKMTLQLIFKALAIRLQGGLFPTRARDMRYFTKNGRRLFSKMPDFPADCRPARAARFSQSQSRSPARPQLSSFGGFRRHPNFF